MLENTENGILNNDSFTENNKIDKFIPAQKSLVHIIHNEPELCLRVHPLPIAPGEPICSVIFRCIVCQLGLATILILWTLIWVFIIHSYEGPYELKVSLEFEKQQNQLVIDLATELRQITPLSPKWRVAIEKRIQEERLLTFLAVGKGARINPGQFWDLAGTFLFNVYVMTALGFGAPVPHTTWGRTCALIYAFVAVPTHIYLMVNMGTCLVRHLEACCYRKRKKMETLVREKTSQNKTVGPSCRRNSDIITKSSSFRSLNKKILRVLCTPCGCLTAALYYVIGVVIFGVIRHKDVFESLMFPLQFTTTGGLEHVEPIVRVVYGLYVEGAMVLLSCALATLRRRSGAAAGNFAHKHRLYQSTTV